MTDSNDGAVPAKPFQPRCLVIDLEVGKKNGRLQQIGALRADTDQRLHWRGGEPAAGLDQLDALGDGAAFVLGHNIIGFDLPQLAALRPGLRLLALPAIDTLRLNPLAFPRNPYHHLVKHYQDGPLASGYRNNPLKDAELALSLFRDQQDALHALNTGAPQRLAAWHWLTTQDDTVSGMSRLFMTLRDSPRPSRAAARTAILACLDGQGCQTQRDEVLSSAESDGWPLAYALAWLSVAGGNSVMPPWVRHQFLRAGEIVRRLRDIACTDPSCAWCREHHDANKALQHWFGFSDFRPEPADAEGHPLQQAIVEAAMAGRHVLGILPTGTGKSVCYQIPALSRFDKTGALTVVISPLVALMADQVAGLKNRHGIDSCEALNGLLSMPERSDVLDRVRLGDVGILIVSPEQLRNRTLRRILEQREIGAWVLDEAHCLSKWGHDFRPDYRYVSRFIKEKAGAGPVPPVLCLTATAKPDVIADILAHFREKVGIELICMDGGANRHNLDFLVAPTTPATKFDDVHRWIETELPADIGGGAIVYCATRKQTEQIAAFLRDKGLTAGCFHAGLSPEVKKNMQTGFIGGELRVIAATNAFGMGIDKPDVRLVIHADIPGSLENYLQEAGRAGRDRENARCVLLYTTEDVERQFGMSARSRLSQKEIRAILKSLRWLDSKKRRGGKGGDEVIATSGEILAEDSDADFARDSATDDTRVRTAISWLEESALLSREENRVQIFPSSLRVTSIGDARKKLLGKTIGDDYRRQLLALVEALIAADADEGISTDELMGVAGLSSTHLRKAFADLETLGLASNDAALTAYVQVGTARPSKARLEAAARLESALIAELRIAAPDLAKGESAPLHLRLVCQHLKNADHAGALPDSVRRLLKSLSADGRDDEGGSGGSGGGSLGLRRLSEESLQVTLQRDWPALEMTADLRRLAAQRLLDHLLARLPAGARGADLLAETTMGHLSAVIEGDIELKQRVKDPQKLIERALLWLHEQEIVRLNKGLTVFRPAMTIRLDNDWKKQFGATDFAPLKLHYEEQVLQIHVMQEYVQRGLERMADALRLAMDYFTLTQDEFLQRWLPGRDKELQRQTTPESWRSIVESLGNKAQRDIVADERESANVLVLAGPGSGKTRVLVHRIAYLVRCRRENPRGILALAYNRHAAAQIRQRLHALIGDDARGVIVLTVHALAMRLTGTSFAERATQAKGIGNDDFFRCVLLEATALLKADELPAGDADGGDDGDGGAGNDGDAMRERLLGGFRWILVDEYQDIGREQYELIAAIAGRTRSDDERINLLAVGDDDQNIYAFAGASIEFIGRFETDYKAKPAYLIDNYRSSAHIIAAANALIAPVSGRMKTAHPIRIDRLRAKAPAGGDWQRRDKVGQGRVQILPAGADAFSQAMAVMAEFERMAGLDRDWNWAGCAVIAREWKSLEPVRSYCEWRGIPVQLASEDSAQFWRLRETQALLAAIAARKSPLVTAREIELWLREHTIVGNPHHALLAEALADYALENGDAELPAAHFREWLAEWGHKARQRQSGLLLVTAHGAKGLEFDHVTVLDGGWKAGRDEEPAAVTRLYYVAMTRARNTLCLARFAGLNAPHHPLLDALAEGPHLLRRAPVDLPPAPPELRRRHILPSLGDIDLGYAGRKPTHDAVHSAIARLSFGSPLRLEATGKGWRLLDGQRNVVGKMARDFKPPEGMHCVGARVHRILVRDKAQSDFEKYGEPRCERWEVVVPEFVFAPADGG
ncbi:MAG: RecQ family ATP-dependent DNA helicase [Sulfuritalea sp.]|nr:RecQ family ATP-dependent DNA helicase [Sulfuritalea sp.]MDP1981640.1 RecQ family ATP-dependent DNA helicase [Sulfuritalea sp.]